MVFGWWAIAHPEGNFADIEKHRFLIKTGVFWG
jgi:hypothetical protein